MPVLEPPYCHESYLVNRRQTTGENTVTWADGET